MRHTGRIYLLDRSGKPVAMKIYNSIGDRSYIISGWLRLYKKAFHNCFIQIDPELKENGTGKKDI